MKAKYCRTMPLIARLDNASGRIKNYELNLFRQTDVVAPAHSPILMPTRFLMPTR
jgi:hypothetical protein